MNIREQAVASVIALINNKVFQCKYKRSAKDFLRDRKLHFATMVSMIIRLVRHSLQIECNFIGVLMKTKAVSKQAFSQARSKILPEAF